MSRLLFLSVDLIDLIPVNKTFAMDKRDKMIFNTRRDKKIVSNFSLISFDEKICMLNLVIRNSVMKHKVR